MFYTAAMVAVIVLVDIRPSSRLWGFLRFVLGRAALRNIPGLQFAKILGSGAGGGFGLKPSATRQGLFCLFANAPSAAAFIADSKIIAAYRHHAEEFFSAILSAYSCRGSWSGVSIPIDTDAPDTGPIAALTRASIRPSQVISFWRKSPPAEADLERASGCLLAVGLGEAPFFRQATFTIWESSQAMDHYARSGAHLTAIKAAHQGQYFSESMFVRFRPLNPQGVWKGRVFA